MRLFVAVHPSPEALDDLTAQLGRLRIGEASAAGVNVRMPARELIHVTVAFLGDVPDDRLPDVTGALDRAVAGWRGDADDGPLRLRLGGGGRFGRGRFTVLWVGVDGDTAGLRRLAGAVRRELRRARLPHDERPYRPHLTVARPGDRVSAETVEEDRATLDGYLGPSWPVSTLTLFRSHLGPKPLHQPMATWSL